MNRYYYICKDLDDISRAEEQLLAAGFSPVQIHTFSHNDADVEKRRLHDVDSFSKKDIVTSTLIGASLGLVGALAIIAVASLLGVTGQAAWVPVLFLAVCVLGFCTWEGGLMGIQTPNREFARFESDLQNGRHIFFVDVATRQKETFIQIISNYASMSEAGKRSNGYSWTMPLRENARKFVHWAP